MKSLISCLIMILFLISTKAQGFQAILLKKNDPAPYQGILAPSEFIRNLEDKAAKADLYKTTIENNKDCLPEIDDIKTPSSGFWEGTAIGAVFTGLMVLIFKH